MKTNQYLIYAGLILTFVLVIFMGGLNISSGHYLFNLVTMLMWFGAPYFLLYIINHFIKNKILIKSILAVSVIDLIVSLILIAPIVYTQQGEPALMAVPEFQIMIIIIGSVAGLVLSKVLKK